MTENTPQKLSLFSDKGRQCLSEGTLRHRAGCASTTSQSVLLSTQRTALMVCGRSSFEQPCFAPSVPVGAKKALEADISLLCDTVAETRVVRAREMHRVSARRERHIRCDQTNRDNVSSRRNPQAFSTGGPLLSGRKQLQRGVVDASCVFVSCASWCEQRGRRTPDDIRGNA